jgi:hypothetical protein
MLISLSLTMYEIIEAGINANPIEKIKVAMYPATD